MTPLRKRMMEELQLRNLSPITADTYISAVERFARHFNQSPARLGSEQVRQYLLHLMQDRKVGPNTLLVQRAALKFLPRLSPQNRPSVITSKPANGITPRTK